MVEVAAAAAAEDKEGGWTELGERVEGVVVVVAAAEELLEGEDSSSDMAGEKALGEKEETGVVEPPPFM